MGRVRLFFQHFGALGLIRLAIYPVTVLVTTPVRLVQSLWAARVLWDRKLDGITHFSARNGLAHLFYLTLADNLRRFGRRGRSPYTGLGDYPLSNWFLYCTPSVFAYRWLTPLVPLFGMFGWLAAHLVWTQQISAWWVGLIIGVALISTSFYGNLFVYQNYNVLGWMFFPLGLYGALTGNWLVAAAAWLAASFASPTVVALAVAVSATIAFTTPSIGPLLAVAPAVLKTATHFLTATSKGEAHSVATSVLKAIGFRRRNVRYRYGDIGVFVPFGRPSFEALYFSVIYGQFVLVGFVATGILSPVLMVALALSIVNASFARFADQQSILMLVMSAATAFVIQHPGNWMLLASYWLLIAPLPLMMQMPHRTRIFDVVPVYPPFSIHTLATAMDQFLGPVKEGQRVLMAFDDPGTDYDRLFDGYRVLIELPVHVATRRNIHFMPDWWSVFEVNYEGAPHFWGRDPESVLRNARQWRADYVVAYTTAGSKLERAWSEAGFEPVGRFSWGDYEEELRGERLYLTPTPDWWLMKVPVPSSIHAPTADAFPALATVE